MKSGARDQVEGRFHKVKDKLRKFTGKIIINSGPEAGGKDVKEARLHS